MAHYCLELRGFNILSNTDINTLYNFGFVMYNIAHVKTTKNISQKKTIKNSKFLLKYNYLLESYIFNTKYI